MNRLSLPTVFLGMIILIGLPASWAEAASSPASNTTSLAVPLCKSAYKQKSVSTKTLQTLLRSHERWVEYRGNPDAKRMELCQADLSRAALAGANLERADLEGTVLRQAKLSQVNLAQASLAGA
ncbi:MAG: pentapeptide repeat-containing protein, partial [Nitrospira sp.]